MHSVISKRILSIIVDIGVILLYAMLLYLAFSIVNLFVETPVKIHNPFIAQLTGFISLTLPVFLYYYFTDKNSKRGSYGKRWNNLSLVVIKPAGKNAILLRTIIKLLPWEIAHTGVHWLMFYLRKGDSEPPFWVWIALILPQIIILVYAISIIYFKGSSSVYDKIAGTEIKLQPVGT